VVCAFGVTLLVLGTIVKLTGWQGHVRAAALAPPAATRRARR
jgi:hypothetical protein